MRISVVVPTRNRADLLMDCLGGLQAQTRKADEIIVVDNDSSDGTASRVAAAFPAVRVLHEPSRGVVAARNTGLDAASGDVVAFTDDDCLTPPGWLDAIASCFLEPHVLCAGGPTRPLWPEPPSAALLASRRALSCLGIIDLGPRRRPLDAAADFLIGANLAVRKAAVGGGFLRVQAFRSLGECGEDYELSRRLAREGGGLYEPEAWVHHRILPVKMGWWMILKRIFYFAAVAGRGGARIKPRRGPLELLGWEGPVSVADALGNLYGRWAASSSHVGGAAVTDDSTNSRCHSASETGFKKP